MDVSASRLLPTGINAPDPQWGLASPPKPTPCRGLRIFPALHGRLKRLPNGLTAFRTEWLNRHSCRFQHGMCAPQPKLCFRRKCRLITLIAEVGHGRNEIAETVVYRRWRQLITSSPSLQPQLHQPPHGLGPR